MKKFVLLPEAKHRQMMKIDTRDVLQSIKQPEQREMLKRYELAQNILHDNQRLNDDTKMNEYRELMQDFSTLRDRQGGRQLTEQLVVKKRDIDGVNKQEEGNGVDTNIDTVVVDALPNSQKVNANKLIRLLRSHGNDLVSWTPQSDVSIRGQHLRGVNIVDLFGDVVRVTPSKSMPPPPEQFVNALAEANIPETLIKNRAALKHYRAIKNDGSHQDIEKKTPSTLHQDDVLPNMKKRKSKQMTTTEPIDWNASL